MELVSVKQNSPDTWCCTFGNTVWTWNHITVHSWLNSHEEVWKSKIKAKEKVKIKTKIKVKLFLCHFLSEHYATEAYWGSRGIAPCILDLGTRWRWVVSFTLLPVYPQGKSYMFPLDRRLCGPQSRSGRGSKERNSLPLPGFEPPIIQPIAKGYTTEISYLVCKNSRKIY
jgi:hypothetical protein